MSQATHRVLFLLGPERVELRQQPIPEPGAGELLVRVVAAATCGTDLKVYRRGGHPRMLETPCPFGHELAGTVVGCGSGVQGWREGDRVVVVNSASCGVCEQCRRGRENLCSDLHYLNGAYADHLLVPPRFVRRSTYHVSGGVDPAVVALAEPLACVLHGLSVCRLGSPDEAVVLGAGPIGLMFVLELAHRGHRVIVGDPVADRLAVAARLGAAETVALAGDGDDTQRLAAASASRGGAELVVEATGEPQAWSNAMGSVRAGGTVVLFGGCAPGTQVALDTHRLHYSEITVQGVYHHRPPMVRAALDRIADRAEDLSIILTEEHPLEGVEVALRRMAERRILKAAIRPELCAPRRGRS